MNTQSQHSQHQENLQSASQSQHRRLIILGSGPAGCTAAVYTARANLNPTMITGEELGGQLVKTSIVDNWPGDAAGVAGVDLMQRMQRHIERFAVETIYDHIIKVNLARRPLMLQSTNTTYTCDALIAATGASPKYLGLPAEQQFLGHGVSTCATCDGFFYRGAKVAVVGGGNTALEEALYLTDIAEQVTLIHRRDVFTADHTLVEKLRSFAAQGKIKILQQHVITDITGDEQNGVRSIAVKNLANGEITTLPIAGLFVAVGFKPNSTLFTGKLDISEDGYIKIKNGDSGNFTATSIEGVFAAGDVANRAYRQAIAAAGMGCMAAIDAQRYLAMYQQ